MNANTMYVFNSSEMYQYFPLTDEWQKLNITVLPSSNFYYFSFLTIDDQVWFIDYYSSTFWIYNPVSQTWSKYLQITTDLKNWYWSSESAFYDGTGIILNNGAMSGYYKIYIYK